MFRKHAICQFHITPYIHSSLKNVLLVSKHTVDILFIRQQKPQMLLLPCIKNICSRSRKLLPAKEKKKKKVSRTLVYRKTRSNVSSQEVCNPNTNKSTTLTSFFFFFSLFAGAAAQRAKFFRENLMYVYWKSWTDFCI